MIKTRRYENGKLEYWVSYKYGNRHCGIRYRFIELGRKTPYSVEIERIRYENKTVSYSAKAFYRTDVPTQPYIIKMIAMSPGKALDALLLMCIHYQSGTSKIR